MAVNIFTILDAYLYVYIETMSL